MDSDRKEEEVVVVDIWAAGSKGCQEGSREWGAEEAGEEPELRVEEGEQEDEDDSREECCMC